MIFSKFINFMKKNQNVLEVFFNILSTFFNVKEDPGCFRMFFAKEDLGYLMRFFKTFLSVKEDPVCFSRFCTNF